MIPQNNHVLIGLNLLVFFLTTKMALAIGYPSLIFVVRVSKFDIREYEITSNVDHRETSNYPSILLERKYTKRTAEDHVIKKEQCGPRCLR